jgi:pimeloyl-ACP methyl ester carboxylesterase
VKTTVQERRVNVDGLCIRYFTAGCDDPPLILIHGDGESAIDWSWVIPGLAVNTCVYALDLPGSGDSAKPNREYSPEFFAQFMVKFLDALEIERAIVVGNSLGGLIALRLALSHPEKVAALVLVDRLCSP